MNYADLTFFGRAMYHLGAVSGSGLVHKRVRVGTDLLINYLVVSAGLCLVSLASAFSNDMPSFVYWYIPAVCFLALPVCGTIILIAKVMFEIASDFFRVTR